jgi:hypothetical protein
MIDVPSPGTGCAEAHVVPTPQHQEASRLAHVIVESVTKPFSEVNAATVNEHLKKLHELYDNDLSKIYWVLYVAAMGELYKAREAKDLIEKDST